MSDDDLIRRGDVLAAVYEQHPEWTKDAIAALPAVTVGVKPEAALILAKEMQAIVAADRWKGRELSAAPPEKWSHLRPETQQFWIDTATRILAALEPVALTPNAVDDSQTADPAVNAPDYSLAPHLQRIVEGAKTTTQWDTMSDRMTAPDPAAIREAALLEAAEVCTYVIKNIEILKADGETYETPRVHKVARGLVDVARQDILALIPKGDDHE